MTQERCSWLCLAVAVVSTVCALTSTARAADDGEAAFRELYRELVEINTTLSEGSCTTAAEAMAARLRAAGFPADAVEVLVPVDQPKDGNLVARLEGRDPALEPILLLAHIDVVEAKREDWERDPFKLVEENGYFYGRGASDDKAMAAIFTDSLIRYQAGGLQAPRDDQAGAHLRRGDGGAFNGVRLAARATSRELHRRRVRAQRRRRRAQLDGKRQAWSLDDPGRREGLPGLHAGERPTRAATARGRCRTTRSTSWPTRCVELGALRVPDRAQRRRRARTSSAQAALAPRRAGAAMRAVVAGPAPTRRPQRDRGATIRRCNAMLRTTCVATMLDGGPRRERAAAARQGERQLPHPAGHDDQAVQEKLRRARRRRSGS